LGQETPAQNPSRAGDWLARPSVAALYAVTTLLIASAAARSVYRAHTDRMRSTTGAAEWIWYSSRILEPRPLRFIATREFELPVSPAAARAKLFVDREHALYVNGERVGSGIQARGDPLAIYEIAPHLRAGVNRLAVEAASPTGIGGILFSLDVDGYGRDALVSDGRWRVDLAREAILRGGRFVPQVWGRPPQFPWGYPRMPRPEETESLESQVSSLRSGSRN
jgi:hypothetical protein